MILFVFFCITEIMFSFNQYPYSQSYHTLQHATIIEPADLKWLFICILLTQGMWMNIWAPRIWNKDQNTNFHNVCRKISRKIVLPMSHNHHVAISPDIVGQNRSQALFRKPHCIFRGNKCGLEGSHYHRSRLVRVSLSYSLATVETPQDRKMGSGMTACSKLRWPSKLLSNIWDAKSNRTHTVSAQCKEKNGQVSKITYFWNSKDNYTINSMSWSERSWSLSLSLSNIVQI